MDRAINSVLNQTFKDFELILIDDCSADGTLDRAKQLAKKDGRIRVIAHDANKGSGPARNTGIENAQGRFIAFVDSDDYWAPDKLETQVPRMLSEGAVLSYTDYCVRNVEGKSLFTFESPDKITYSSMLKRPAIGCSTAIIDVGTIGKRYFPTMRKSEDFALWLSILRDYPAYKCGGNLTFYTARPGSVSSNKLASAYYTWRVLRNSERLNLLKASYYFSHYAGGNIIKRLFSKR